MNQAKFKITQKDPLMMELVERTSKKILAMWAIECANRVLPFFENKYPGDNRPRKALETLQEWIDTGFFKMSVIRSASLDSHAAAREVAEDNSARSAARACGQAVATVHVKSHAYGSAIYAQQAVFRASVSSVSARSASKERDWQYNLLVVLERKN